MIRLILFYAILGFSIGAACAQSSDPDHGTALYALSDDGFVLHRKTLKGYRYVIVSARPKEAIKLTYKADEKLLVVKVDGHHGQSFDVKRGRILVVITKEGHASMHESQATNEEWMAWLNSHNYKAELEQLNAAQYCQKLKTLNLIGHFKETSDKPSDAR